MKINKVIVRYKNGEVMKGSTGDFIPNKDVFHLKLLNGEPLYVNIEELKVVHFVKDLEISIEELKAVFIVKSFEGNKDRKDKYTDDMPGGGRKVQVEFSDGEVLIGYTQDCTTTRHGFFVVPADLQNNNDRIYVITSAIKNLTVL